MYVCVVIAKCRIREMDLLLGSMSDIFNRLESRSHFENVVLDERVWVLNVV